MLVFVSGAVRYRFDPRPRASLNSPPLLLWKSLPLQHNSCHYTKSISFRTHSTNNSLTTGGRSCKRSWDHDLPDRIMMALIRTAVRHSLAVSVVWRVCQRPLSVISSSVARKLSQDNSPGRYVPPPFFVVSCACFMRPPSLGTIPYQAH